MNNTTTITPDTTVYEWEMEYYSPTEEEWLECSYWTFTEDSQMAREQFITDESGTDYEDFQVTSVTEHTYSKLIDWYGEDSLKGLILDYDYTTQEDLED